MKKWDFVSYILNGVLCASILVLIDSPINVIVIILAFVTMFVNFIDGLKR